MQIIVFRLLAKPPVARKPSEELSSSRRLFDRQLGVLSVMAILRPLTAANASDETSDGLEAVHKAGEQQPEGLKKPMQQ
jgi:hypothetical protein